MTDIRKYDVTWDSPSENSLGSMPLGNGDIGLNVWVEASGDILYTVGKTDAWDDNARLAKVGQVRMHFDPPLVGNGLAFSQRLNLKGGEIEILSHSLDAVGSLVKISLWVDANHPVVHADIDAKHPVTVTTSFEIWRQKPTTLPSIEISDVQFDWDAPHHQHASTVVEPDTVLDCGDSQIGWAHHNVKSVGPSEMMAFQDLSNAPWHDPLKGRVFGALIREEGASRSDANHLVKKGTHHHIQTFVTSNQSGSIESWQRNLEQVISGVDRSSSKAQRDGHLKWWQDFWNRSWIDIEENGIASADAFAVAQGYNLQRFITACGGRGSYPIKYNGSIFTTAWPGQPGDADYRRWGPGYWWQNTRLAYAGLSTSGDFDLLGSLFHMYGGEAAEVGKYRAERYFGFKDSLYYPECIYPWGAVFMESYGWKVPAKDRTDKLQTSGYHKWEWVGGLELAFMMLDYYEHTHDRAFLKKTLLPVAIPVLRFFDNFYKKDASGKLVMFPSQAVETWWDCTGPMPEIAGLHAVSERLLSLSANELSSQDRNYITAFQAKIPDLPIRVKDGVTMLAPAQRFEKKNNIENPELYAVFPFRLVSFEKPNAKLGVEALHAREDRGAFGWRHEDIFMAYLGLASEAKEYVVERAKKHDEACRFPAFWGPNYDWTPDQTHGGVLMKAVQAMILQTEGKKIFVLPAWPKEWNLKFKLHAPYQTTVEGEYRDGKLRDLKVSPASRMSDVVMTSSKQ